MANLSPYLQSNLKTGLDNVLALLMIIGGLPILGVIAICIFIDNGGPVFFVQERIGKEGRIFNIFKFRTMIIGAEKQQNKYQNLNQADGPVFKVAHDPRFTKFGRILSKCGLDELPQLMNVIKGEMSLVGPRPLPLPEERQISKFYRQIRQLAKPGITSTWVINGANHICFRKWMELDVTYIEQASFKEDIKVLFRSAWMLVEVITQLNQSQNDKPQPPEG